MGKLIKNLGGVLQIVIKVLCCMIIKRDLVFFIKMKKTKKEKNCKKNRSFMVPGGILRLDV